MKKKLLSILLTGTMVASMGALASISASALVDDNGAYVPGDNVECGTNKYYFALPKAWENDFSSSAGIYWWGGTDACGALDGSGGNLAWPGYKAHEAGFETGMYSLYSIDCPKDVELIIWNNYVDGGMDPEAPQYSAARQSNDAQALFYAAGDNMTYDEDFLMAMEESYNGDKAALGEYADNFFYDEEYGAGFVMNFDNMIFIVPSEPNGTSSTSGMPTYNGEWYFYYGEGEYGTYPTKEAAEAAGTLANLGQAAVLPTTPANTNPVPNPSPNPTSATKPATPGQANKNPNGAVQTGEASTAIVLFAVLASVSGVIVFARKKHN